MHFCFETNIIFIEVYLCIQTPLHFLSKYHPPLFISFISEPIRFLDNTSTTGLISNYRTRKNGGENLEVRGSDHNLSHIYHDDSEGILAGFMVVRSRVESLWGLEWFTSSRILTAKVTVEFCLLHAVLAAAWCVSLATLLLCATLLLLAAIGSSIPPPF